MGTQLDSGRSVILLISVAIIILCLLIKSCNTKTETDVGALRPDHLQLASQRFYILWRLKYIHNTYKYIKVKLYIIYCILFMVYKVFEAASEVFVTG